MGPKWNHNILNKSEAEKDYSQKRRKQCDHRGRDWSIAAISQGMPSATKSCWGPGMDSPLEVLEGAGLSQPTL